MRPREEGRLFMANTSVASEAQVHLLAIRKALANRNAAVMVGAGFSRNANGGENLATWSQLSEEMAAELEPERQPGTFSPAAASQLAEQYSRVFSPSHLEHLIKRCVPDDQVTPGPLHTALLKLPWAEVFTTNYDTLLEREAEKLFEVPYFTVYSREDIPQSKILNRRRIVKLHGSFPSHRPFILTEEHYRTYPEKFAPFVNLVRQSLLENVFCLIGFSGDDPNFLHWLGWVRDMLNKHALPVYLFLGEEPTLGERKLYEARGVVPVLLPIGANGDRKDYQTRYWKLFKDLETPLSDSPLDWGDYPLLHSLQQGDSTNKELSWFLCQLPALTDYRSTYPGWLVAPSNIRNRFRAVANWLESFLHQALRREQIAALPPQTVFTIIELYCWVQQVVLAPLDDNLAAIGRDAVLAQNSHAIENLPEETSRFLKNMGISDASCLRKTWKQAAIALLAWARQSHRAVPYNELREKLQQVAKQDPVIQDRLVYEDVLRHLQNADRVSALESVTKWRPKSSDTFIQVLKASLLAEVGDPSSAISLYEQAILSLRRQQRSRPDDPELISKEAWACLIASLIQRAVEFSETLQRASRGVVQDEGYEEEREQHAKEDFNDRVNALGARGYSAREELKILMAALNAEAEIPSSNRQRVTHFDLGSTSITTRHGSPSDLREKISASFAWLELIERIGLMPYTRNGNFYAKEMLQAAWWARFADRPERSTGLLLRANQKDALKPRDIALPPHRTGWLNRYEIALLSEDTAKDLVQELIRLITAEFNGRQQASGTSGRTEFLIEVFGRLVIRIGDESLLLHLAQQLISLHSTASFQSTPSMWKPTCQALSRTLESMSNRAQSRTLFLVFQLPVAPSIGINDYHLEDWFNVLELTRHFSADGERDTSLDWRLIARDLIFKLRAPRSSEPSWLVWRRLEELRQVGLLTPEETQEVGDLLWGTVEPGQWPVIPNSRAALTLNWPVPSGDAASQFLDKLLNNTLRPFGSGYMQLSPAHGRRSYSIGGASLQLSEIWFALMRSKPSTARISKLLDVVEEWISVDQDDLLNDLNASDDLRDSVGLIIDYLDEILAHCVHLCSLKKKDRQIAKIRTRVLTLDEKLKKFSFERMKLHFSLMSSGDRTEGELDDLLRNIVCNINSDCTRTSGQAVRVAATLLMDSSENFQERFQPIFDAMVASVYARRMPSLPKALDILASLRQENWNQRLDSRSLLFLDVALDDLATQLAYGSTSRDPSIPEELVPLLRYKTVQLAYSIIETAGAESDGAMLWLKHAPDDPLPELRLGRYKVSK